MAYCTKDGLIDAFGFDEIRQLSDRDNTGQIDGTAVERAIARAGAEIDPYLRAGGYSLPLPSTPQLVDSLALDIARYLLAGNFPTEQMRTRYEDAMRKLKLIADSKLDLGLDAAGAAVAAPAGADLGGEDRTFGRTNTEAF